MQRADLIQTLTAHLTALDTTNTAALLDALRLPFNPQGSLRYRGAAFDHRKDQPVSAPRQTAATNAILILNGIFLQRPELSPHWDLTLFLHCDFDISPARGGTRDKAQISGSAETETRYRKRYIPGQRLYFDDLPPLDKADIVIENNILDAPFLSNSTARQPKVMSERNYRWKNHPIFPPHFIVGARTPGTALRPDPNPRRW